MTTRLQNVFAGRLDAPPPIWLMRQAGRYLPEYHAIRQKAGSFLDLCFTPELAAEVTLQPIRRFDFDAAIIFADILLLPQAWGFNLRFLEGEGPRLDALQNSDSLTNKTITHELDAVYEALRLVRKELPADKSLIGFCGAPFTVACYMIAGGKSDDNFTAAQSHLKNHRADFLRTLDFIAEASGDYLCRQIEAGADCLQIFESWAGLVAGEDWEECVIKPIRKIIRIVHQRYPQIPLIVFPRGAKGKYSGFAKATGCQALGLDQTLSLDIAKALQEETIIQGNLDPEILITGGQAQHEAVKAILTSLSSRPFIFNLGHGILPQTPPDHVLTLVQNIRNV
jgi:uroporphyrinogen decarboxylase